MNPGRWLGFLRPAWPGRKRVEAQPDAVTPAASVPLAEPVENPQQTRGPQFEELKASVESCLPLLPLVGAQLLDSNRQLEQAVANVGSSFRRMVQMAREGANEASRMVGAGGPGQNGIEASLAGSRATLEQLMDRILRDGETSGKLIETTQALRNDLRGIVKALAQIDRITSGHTILALNARLEAVRIGDRGAGFAVVAQELKTAAAQSEAITETIRTTAYRLSASADAVESDIRRLACSDRARIAELQGQVQDALGHLEGAHQDMQGSVAESRKRNRALSEDIASAVETLQFQDRFSQRIAHIVAAVESMRAELEEQIQAMGPSPPGRTRPSKALELLDSYTMHGERSVHHAALGHSHAEEAALADIEIF